MLDGLTAKQAIDKLGFKVVADESQLLELVKKAIAANPKAVADFKKGKVKALSVDFVDHNYVVCHGRDLNAGDFTFMSHRQF